MSTTFGGFECCDPVTEAASAASLGQPPSPWFGEVNSFECPLGPGPGRGLLLMTWEGLARLDREASHDLVMAGEVRGRVTRVVLKNLVVGNAFVATCGARDDSAGTFFVEVMDRRCVAAAGPPLNASYNVRDAAGTGYLNASKNGGSAWTWATMTQAIWDANTFLGAWPGLPFTPEGTPEGFVFWGMSSYSALNAVLDRIGCALRLDPEADAYSIVRISTDDEDAERALRALDGGLRIWDAYPVEPVRPRVPEKVRIHFPEIHAADDGTGASGYHTLDRTDPTTGGPLPGTQAGTYAPPIFDDLSAVYDSSDTLTNAAALGTRADERAADYFRRLREERLSRRFSGLYAGHLLPGKRLKGVAWMDRGAGVLTDAYRVPGYGPPDGTLTGAYGAAEPAAFPGGFFPGGPGAGGGVFIGGGGDGAAGGGGFGIAVGPGGRPGGAGRAGADGGAGAGLNPFGVANGGGRAGPGMAGGLAPGALAPLLWPFLIPLVRQQLALIFAAGGGASKYEEYFRHVGTYFYYAGHPRGDTATWSPALPDTVYAWPFLAPRGGTLDRIRVRIQSAAPAGSEARLGIYANTSDTDLRPGALVLDAGVVATDSTGDKTITIAQAITANRLYWLAMAHDDNGFILDGFSSAGLWAVLGHSPTSGEVGVGWYAAHAFAALPDPFPAPTAYGVAVGAPAGAGVGVRYSA